MVRTTEARQSASEQARQLLTLQPLFLDTETTGIDANAEVVEICILDADGQVLLDSLVKPRRPIPSDAIRVHGITNSMIQTAPIWETIWPQIQEIARGRKLGIYNAEFDLRMLRQTHQQTQLPWNPTVVDAFCIMKLYAQFYGDWDAGRRSYRWQSLDKAGRQCKLTLPNAHRAQADALLARAVLHYMTANG